MSKLSEFVDELEFGKRYYKPHGTEWNNLAWLIEYTFPKFTLHKMRGSMFCLKCKCCGSTDQ